MLHVSLKEASLTFADEKQFVFPFRKQTLPG